MHLYLAPILGHTDYVFRNAFLRHFQGLDRLYTPFLTSVKGSYVKDSHLTDILPKFNKVNITVPQILSKDPDEFIVIANQINSMGYKMVNWNLGCPYPMVVNKKRGAGLLPYPEKIKEFLDAVSPKISCRLSIKMRLGNTESDDIYKVIEIFNTFPVSEIIIHPRTAKQMYSGVPNLDIFETCLSLCSHPVVYNGDITDLKTYQVIVKRFKTISAVMIGRGIAMNPALAEMIKNESLKLPEDYLNRIYKFHEDILRTYRGFDSGIQATLGRMKQLWWYLSHSVLNQEETLKKIQRTKTFDEYRKVISEVFKSG